MQAVSWHSEKLAVAFGMMTTMLRTRIHIVKFLRTCEGCHSAPKAISEAYGREDYRKRSILFSQFQRRKLFLQQPLVVVISSNFQYRRF